jgi:hypothetical protein
LLSVDPSAEDAVELSMAARVPTVELSVAKTAHLLAADSLEAVVDAVLQQVLQEVDGHKPSSRRLPAAFWYLGSSMFSPGST